jgi:outer membrane cobalamin receptor
VAALWPLLGLVAGQAGAAEDGGLLPDVVVTGTREGTSLNETPAAVGVIPKGSIERTRPNHPSQLLGQVPGVSVAVTNGEGHATAIRQPFTTNPVYLFLEDGIPIRSTGFFNHNALYEINIPHSGGMEVTRGPGAALYGSDAIDGIVNVLTRTPSTKPEVGISAELGGHGFSRVLAGANSPLVLNDYVNNPTRNDLPGSVYNVADKRYADSAQLSSNQPVLSPGLPRTFYAGLEAKW